MHIKKIIIQGFKTYKNTTVIDLLSPQHNVVVGRNGSGKSNFFAAIRFVLSDAYTHMTREERKGLIHEGSGNVMSAYVEIVFDNTERRFPISKDEIAVRRTIGLKKDDYSLDGKSATRSDIMNLLESAGFSRSNPYYIVPQGRITALTNSKDAERLSLLKEVSGAKVFESKLKESMKEMANSNYKKQRTDEALQSLDARLSDLQIESTDLKEYQSLEKNKKLLEYKLFDRELNTLNTKIEQNEEDYTDLLENSKQDIEDLNSREALCQQLIDSIGQLKTDLKVATLEKLQTDIDSNQLYQLIAEKEVEVNNLRANLSSVEQQSKSNESLVSHYKDLIAKHESKIADYKPKLRSLQEHETEIKLKLAELQTKQRALYSKQSRFSKFTTQKQRDDWLQKEIKSLKQDLKTKQTSIDQIQEKITSHKEELFEYNNRINELNEELNGNNQQSQKIDQLQTSVNELRARIVELTDQRKQLWRDEIRYKSFQDLIENDLSNATHQVNQTMDRAQAKGLAAVKSITEKLNLGESVHGPLAELFHVSDKYKASVEVVAGNSLFHVVVDNDKTASIIMNELVRTNAGRVTFMPLNRIKVPEHTEYPNPQENECIPLIDKIKHDKQKVGIAMRQVFGKTIVCSNLQKGYELAKQFKLNAITLDGDRADTKGTLSGGFRDYKNSRIDALKVQSKKKKELIKIQQELNKCSENIDAVNQELNNVNNELQTKVRGLDQIVSSREPIKTELSQLSNKKFNLEQELSSLEISLNSLNMTKKNLQTNSDQHQAELKSSFTQSLSDEELTLLQQLNNQISQTENELDEVVTELSSIEGSISTIESELNNNYVPHLNKLLDSSGHSNHQLSALELNMLENELQGLKKQFDSVESKKIESNQTFQNLHDELNKHEDLLKDANQQQINIMKKLEKFSKTSERSLSKKSILYQRRDEVSKKISDLGALPEEAFLSTEHNDKSPDAISNELNSINQGLSKFSHINKKAMEQFNTFTREREDLMKRKDELEKSRDSIEQLIHKLEKQKDEAISKSFEQVSKSFHEIFEKLVPAGVGNLIMQKKRQTASEPTASDEEIVGSDDDSEHEGVSRRTRNKQPQVNIDNYVGVSISVSFNSKHDEQQRIEQLSGGQKSLCAIALILAIQECDPAPFYLFDEIDANLDTQYRIAVASMISKLSHSAQFICTTFRPEMLQVANKFYGVMFGNKVSTVSEINREEAMSFVEGQQRR